MRAIVEKKLRFGKERLALLHGCYAQEMAKRWYERNRGRLVFMWKEISVYQLLVTELEDVLSRDSDPPR